MATPIALLPQAEIEPLIGWVDSFPGEDHQMEITKTTYPVEDGAVLTDHAIVKPRRLTLRGFTSNLRSGSGGAPLFARAAASRQEIQRIMAERQPVDVVTLLGNYTDMLIVSFSAPVSRDTGRSLIFTIGLEEIRTATAPTVATVDGLATDRAGEPAQSRAQAQPVADPPEV